MRDRLIELLRDTFNYTKGVCIDFDEAVEINADHLLENGVIVPPCKIGDKVYSVGRNPDTNGWRIREQSIYRIAISSTGIHLYVSPIINFHISAIGTRYFFSREEAEAALAKMKGGAE